MITREAAHRFAKDWAAAWNAHDLDGVLAHYAEDFEMSSPFIAGVAGEASGVLRGKAAVRAYWARALAKFPELRFDVLGVFLGVDSVAIKYKSVHGIIACETFHFDASGKVSRAYAMYNETNVEEAKKHESWFFASNITPVLNVSDVAASLAWFEKLGWRTGWSWCPDGGTVPTFAATGAGECQVFMCLNGQGSRGKGPNRYTFQGPGEDDTMDKGVWMSVWVRNVDEVHERCVAQGLDVTHVPTDEPWGVREMHVRHPDGHVLRVSGRCWV